MEETPEIPTIQHFKRVKAIVIEVVDKAIIKVTIIEEEEEEGNMIRAMYNVIIVKSLDILLVNVIPTRMIHKKLKKNFQGKRMMRAHC